MVLRFTRGKPYRQTFRSPAQFETEGGSVFAMRRGLFLLVLTVAIASVWTAVQPEAAAPQTPSATPAVADDATRYSGVVKQYCSGCHNSRVSTSATASGVIFDSIDLHNVAADAVMWEKVVRKLHAGAMPPPG